MPKGTIGRLTDRGYGFIKIEKEEDLFFHSSSLEGVEFNNLSEGQEVEFEKGQGREGRPAAVKVWLPEIPPEDAGDDSGDTGANGEDTVANSEDDVANDGS
ncbi:cold-shock protein [Chloroflexota bacterium]